jgi:hypothetical protein
MKFVASLTMNIGDLRQLFETGTYREILEIHSRKF